MTSQARDETLDLQKGFSCLLMVVAHLSFVNLSPKVSLELIAHVVGLLPPVIFYGIAGVTASIQVNRYTLPSMLKYFIWLFLLGACWNVVVHGDISAFQKVEIFQLIALGSIGVCLLERNGRAPQWQLLGLAALIMLIKVVVEWRWPWFDGWNYLFCDSDYRPHVSLMPGEKKILPGFPLFPWLSFFFLGVFAYRASKQVKLALAVASLLATIAAIALGSNPIEKWDTTPAYVFANCVVLFSYFWLFHGGGAVRSWIGRLLCRIGSNALLFFFAHPLGVMVGFILYRIYPNPYLAWSVGILIAVGFYLLLNRIKPGKTFQSMTPWVVLVVVIFTAPLLPELIHLKIMELVSRFIAVVAGIVAAVNYPALSKLTRVKRDTPLPVVDVVPTAGPVAD